MPHANDEFPCPEGRPCVRPLLNRTFALFWEHKVLLITTQLILMAIAFMGNYFLSWIGGHMLLGPFILGTYKINLAIVRNEDGDIGDFLSGFEYFLPAFIANILIHMGAFIGLWMFLVPAGIIFITYAPTYFFIFEYKQGFWDAMESSRRLTWGNKKLWLTVFGVAVLVNGAGLLCFIVGLVVTWPFTRLLITLVYEEEIARLQRERDQQDVVVPLDSTPHTETA
jgi:uncharacterized membrane protein